MINLIKLSTFRSIILFEIDHLLGLSDQASFPPIVASMEGFLKGLIMGFCMYTGLSFNHPFFFSLNGFVYLDLVWKFFLGSFVITDFFHLLFKVVGVHIHTHARARADWCNHDVF